MNRNVKKNRLKETMGYVNCYVCQTQLKYKEAKLKPKQPGGDKLVWCKDHYKKQFVRRKELLRK